MEKHQRLRPGGTVMAVKTMRSAMAMIELIFAIVIIAISVLSIPSMMNVADQASKQAVIDEDVMSRLAGWTIDKSQARWDQNYMASGSGPLWITSTADLACSRGSGNVWYRINPDSTVQCNDANATPSAIGTGDGNLSKGIEQLNGGTEPITITAASGETYTVSANYAVSYVSSELTGGTGNTRTATWRLGSSANMAPGAAGTATHLKRVVTRFYNDDLDVDTTLSFFKSNKGN
jgi:Tfp pilus assembly protein PilV